MVHPAAGTRCSPSGKAARKVAGAIQSCAWLRVEGIGNEPFRGQLGAVQVPSRDSVAADAQLALVSGRNRLPVPIEDRRRGCSAAVDPGEACRTRYAAAPGRRDRSARRRSFPSDRSGCRSRIPARDARSRSIQSSREASPPRIRRLRGMSRAGCFPLCSAARWDGTIFRTSMGSRSKYSASIAWLSARSREMTCRRAAGGQGGKDHRVAEVGGDRRHRRVAHAGLEAQPFAHAQDVAHDVPVLDADALGPPRRAARVDDVREVSGRTPAPSSGGAPRRSSRTYPGRCACAAVRGRPARRRLLRSPGRRRRIAEHERDPLRGDTPYRSARRRRPPSGCPGSPTTISTERSTNSPTGTSGPAAPLPQVAPRAVRRGGRARRRSADLLLEHHGDRSPPARSGAQPGAARSISSCRQFVTMVDLRSACSQRPRRSAPS